MSLTPLLVTSVLQHAPVKRCNECFIHIKIMFHENHVSFQIGPQVTAVKDILILLVKNVAHVTHMSASIVTPPL